MKILIHNFLFLIIFFLVSQNAFSQTLKWTSSPRDDSYQRVGWFMIKNKPLELRFWQFDYHTRILLIMDGPLSNNAQLELNLSDYGYFGSSIDFSESLDYNGDGLNDIIIEDNYPSPSHVGIRILDFTNGQILFQLDDVTYSYGIDNVIDFDGDGKNEIAIERRNLSTNLSETLVYATNGSSLSSSRNNNDLPSTFQLKQNYPNPFNPSTTIEYEINNPENVKINIYDITGSLIKELVNEQKNTGKYTIVWNGRDNSGNIVVSGTYFYQIISDNFVQAKKMILLK